MLNGVISGQTRLSLPIPSVCTTSRAQTIDIVNDAWIGENHILILLNNESLTPAAEDSMCISLVCPAFYAFSQPNGEEYSAPHH